MDVSIYETCTVSGFSHLTEDGQLAKPIIFSATF